MTAANLFCETLLLKRMVAVKAVGWAGILLGLFLLAGVLGGVVAGRRTGRPERGFGKPVGNFTLRDAATGQSVTFDSLRDQRAVVLVFLGIDCPISNLMLPRLNTMAETYGARGAKVFGVNSNAHEDAVQVAEHARVHGVRFPMLLDEGQAVAQRFQVDRMCEVLVVDQSGYLRYRGALDDQYGRGTRKDAPRRAYVAEALNAVLAGGQVTVPDTPVFGCLIERTKSKVAGRSLTRGRPGPGAAADQREAADASPAIESVTYAADVATIVQEKCQYCHRPGQAGPFSLLTYAQVRRHSAMIREVVDERRMPPWHADPRFGQFANDRSLSPRERRALLAWIDQGTPEGDRKSMPSPRAFAEGWTIGTPDVVLSMPEVYSVPATGTVPYQHFQVATGFTEDRWVQAAEVQPGDRSVVHHIFVRVITTDGSEDKANPKEPFFAAFVVGDAPSIFPPGTARKVPAGAELHFEVHYSPTGVSRPDRSAIGLIFAKTPPVHQVITKGIKNGEFVIPPGAKNHEVQSTFTFRSDSHLLSLMPHMHLRGQNFRYTATFPDGRIESLLSVPAYDFSWQSVYRLETAKPMPRGTRLDCVAHFDNSADNPVNPNPSQTVRWGEQTSDEMMIGYIDYYIDERVIPSSSALASGRPPMTK
jgi:peroxiredoxin